MLDASDLSASPPPADDLDLEPRIETEVPNKDDVSSHIFSVFFMNSKAYQMENLVNKSGKEISEEARN